MKAMCQISKGDVAACVKHMRETSVKYNLYQVGDKKYHDADKDREQAFDVAAKREFTHVIEMDNGVLHTMTCKKAGDNTIKAHIVKGHEEDTGLTLCTCVKRAISRRK